MCSDGLSNMVENEEIFKLIHEAAAAGADPAAVLVNQANENGGKDNIAVVVVQPFDEEENIC